ncbi:MAG: hypothetical protein IT364_27280 [Candidatus Hydrogenedentes bacterium]|nr:hypothetical protein [Candidatus Hydrogenedentota bacterium]
MNATTESDQETLVFKHELGLRVASAIAATIAVLVALSMTGYFLITGHASPEFMILLAIPWSLSPVFIYIALRLQAKIVVDDTAIRSVGVCRSISIPFADVTEAELDRPHLFIRSKRHAIRADHMIAGLQELKDAVERRLDEASWEISDEDVAEERDPNRYGYAKQYVWAVRFEVALLVFVTVLLPWTKPSEPNALYTSILLIVLACTAGALYWLHRTRTTVELTDNFLCWQRGRRVLTIPYEEIQQATVKKARPFKLCLELVWKDKRLRIPAVLTPFDRLVVQLSQKIPVSWVGGEHLQFPISVRMTSWLEQSTFGLMAGFFLLGCFMMMKDSHSPLAMTIILSGASALTGLFSILLATILQPVEDWPRRIQVRRTRIIFGKRRFVIVKLWKTETFRARDVTNVRLRFGDGPLGAHVLEISLGERCIVLYEIYVDALLVPLYKALCQAYWPEGYVEPGTRPRQRRVVKRR